MKRNNKKLLYIGAILLVLAVLTYYTIQQRGGEEPLKVCTSKRDNFHTIESCSWDPTTDVNGNIVYKSTTTTSGYYGGLLEETTTIKTKDSYDNFIVETVTTKDHRSKTITKAVTTNDAGTTTTTATTTDAMDNKKIKDVKTITKTNPDSSKVTKTIDYNYNTNLSTTTVKKQDINDIITTIYVIHDIISSEPTNTTVVEQANISIGGLGEVEITSRTPNNTPNDKCRDFKLDGLWSITYTQPAVETKYVRDMTLNRAIDIGLGLEAYSQINVLKYYNCSLSPTPPFNVTGKNYNTNQYTFTIAKSIIGNAIITSGNITSGNDGTTTIPVVDCQGDFVLAKGTWTLIITKPIDKTGTAIDVSGITLDQAIDTGIEAIDIGLESGFVKKEYKCGSNPTSPIHVTGNYGPIEYSFTIHWYPPHNEATF